MCFLFHYVFLEATEMDSGAHGRLPEEDQPAECPLCWEDQSPLPPL